MSTILKALERLEKEKQGGAPRPGSAGELSVVRPGVPQEPRRRWLWLAGGVGALALTGLLALWLRPLVDVPGEEPPGAKSGLAATAPPQAAAPAPAAPPASPVPPPAPAAAPLPGTPEPAPPIVAETQAPTPTAPAAPPAVAPAAPLEPVVQAAVPAPVEPVAPPEPAPLAAGEPPAQAQPMSTAVAPVEPAPVAEAAPAPIDDAAPGRAVVEPAPAPPPPAREIVRPRQTAPKPRPPPAVARAPEPKVAVERTVWHPDATRRRAWVRLEDRASTELREGDALGGIAVRRIEPSGVVFVVEGRELRRAVGALP